MTLDPVFSHGLSLGLALLLVSAGLGKFRHLEAFSKTLRGYRLLPESMLRLAVIAIPAVEISLALGMVVLAGLQVKLAALPVAGLLTFYAGAIYINIRRGNLSLECGCQFGHVRQTISMALVYRNLLLAGAALLLLLPPVDRVLSAYDLIAVVFTVLTSALFYMTANKLISNATNYRQVLA